VLPVHEYNEPVRCAEDKVVAEHQEAHAMEVPGGGMGEEAGIIILVLDFI
jgi:hypothetical protein